MSLAELIPARWRADAELLAAALEGNQRAVATLVDRLMPRAHAMAWRLTASQADAEDVVQEAFLRLWRDGARLAPRAEVATWFLTVVRNLCFDRLRRHRETVGADMLEHLADAAPTPEERCVAAGDAERLRSALARLPDRQRAALMMWAWEDCSADEIARVLEIETNAAHQLLHRARQRLRAILEEGEGADATRPDQMAAVKEVSNERQFIR